MVKKLSYFLIPIVVVFLIVIFFSEKTTKYECIGILKSSTLTKDGVKLFVRYDDFYPWTKLWNQSDGGLRVEIPNHWTQYFTFIQNTDDKDEHLHIFKKKNDPMSGFFSKFSRSIWLKIDLNNEIYEGECKELK